MTHPCRANGSNQITHWWQEAERAAHLGKLPRARRFLRWIVSCCPEEEEGWLVLASLAEGSREQIPILKGAYRFHPHSPRVQAALREARQRQLESSVGELKARGAVPRLLPDERQLPPAGNGRSGNGHGPVAGNGHGQSTGNGYHVTQDAGPRRLWRPAFLDLWPGRQAGPRDAEQPDSASTGRG